ncbi:MULTISPECIES: 3-isopropylmalate dehydrogenase [Prochlorococcus]|uniref:3-isopropylmalate dehydrogenase n=1 Tax=Prochlorococcus marinus (strain SARG / CCMP1375 / SS120) TaxID=167539 RepID=LEU3_PROMA|nr:MULTISPECIES: 3-isopropylmalate dehydrogenase [Prochlorococcus]Q7VC80.1 RecName: Full=3-isopropylmalate dehydrogenase; AltName: Full=3-IPM-DH; AltName: Full=Beta-IPM dehydrogenase; Short=IMDH [Prochlorococcus marinus subsp. marinus str. CCMP1375]AAP99906.1 Isocitrate dehydrogenase [Prochlorococcus marinus subsp. marinus str. CCMP1375]KGG11746.1 3-isopropylmalate dehydrogenase [Prochlorococcus marinus str. LG]KGG18840.1 3-isopropylmalate dehydrogenase [Prochlorococcus marinus str. SS2]KGG236
MASHKITLLTGDGIGPEISIVAKKILAALSEKHSITFTIEEKPFGGQAIELTGKPLPEDTLNSCKASDAVLLAAIGDPKYDDLPRDLRPETGLLNLRAGLNLFANIRPIKIRQALISSSSLKSEIIKDVDLVVVRELTGGIYFGQPKGRISTEEAGERAFNTMTYSDYEIDRIAKIAFDLSETRRKKICSIDKANVLEVSQLWRERVIKAQEQYPNIELTHQYVDNAAMQLVREPAQFDVILTSNLFGDIISDEAAMLTGSIGMLPSASLGEDGPGVFEPVHGSAPDIAHKNLANPIAMILSTAMMLRTGLMEYKAATDLENAIDKVLGKGFRTIDLNRDQSNTKLGCREMGDQIIKAINGI